MVKLLATENAAQRLGPLLAKRGLKPELVSPRDLDRLLGADAVHQGVMLEAEPLPFVTLDDVDANGILLVLDQVTDPQNVGAALRSAAAFGASGLVMTERHSPPLHGVTGESRERRARHREGDPRQESRAELWRSSASAACCAWVSPSRRARPLESAPLTRPLALVLGAEGKGLRQLTREHCDRFCAASRRKARWRASTCRTPPRSRSTGRASYAR